METKIRICHVIGGFVNGGVESVIYNYFSHMDLDEFEVHIIGHGIDVQECADRFAELGFHIHNITPKRVSFARNLKEMYGIFRKYRFHIVHSHMTEWACVPMFLAWLLGIRTRINHSHMAEKPTGFLNSVYYGVRLFLGKVFATDYFACGEDAGIYLFGKKMSERGKVTIIPNAIDTEIFRFDPEKRQKLRCAYGISDGTVVLGHVGRFFEQKNHRFLIEIFQKYHTENPDSILLLLGDGVLKQEIENRVKELHLQESVRFMGVRSDVADWYQVMDILVMPSLYEGLPVVGVEAQAAGLPCVFSSEITQGIKISSNVIFLPLQKEPEEWAKTVAEFLDGFERKNGMEVIRDYDIRFCAGRLQEFYVKRATD